MASDPVRGTIKFWAVGRDEETREQVFLGWGFVLLDDARQAFLHYSALPSAREYLAETGDRLECELMEGERGLQVKRAIPVLDSAGDVVNVSAEELAETGEYLRLTLP
jgi:cold shock CspA family protein